MSSCWKSPLVSCGNSSGVSSENHLEILSEFPEILQHFLLRILLDILAETQVGFLLEILQFLLGIF